MQKYTALMLALAATFYACTASSLHNDKRLQLPSRPDSLSGNGLATLYEVGSAPSACGQNYNEDDLVVALSATQMQNGKNGEPSPLCGTKLTVEGPNGAVIVTIDDICPSCDTGNLALSPAAFVKIGDVSTGIVKVSWHSV